MKEKALVRMIEKLLCEYYQVATKEEFFNEEPEENRQAIEIIWDTMVEEAILAYRGQVSDKQRLSYLVTGVVGNAGEW